MNSSNKLCMPHGLVLRPGIRIELVDLFRPLFDVSDEELDPLQGLISSLAHVFDLLLG